MSVAPIPPSYNSVTPYLIIRGAARALDFYRAAFGAVEKARLEAPGGTIGHAEMRIGDSNVMLADEMPQMGYTGPESHGGTPVSLHLYVEDVDRVFARAVEHGATVVRPVADQFYGDRTGTVRDPFGHIWTVSTHIEDVSLEEIDRRFRAMCGQGGKEGAGGICHAPPIRRTSNFPTDFLSASPRPSQTRIPGAGKPRQNSATSLWIAARAASSAALATAWSIHAAMGAMSRSFMPRDVIDGVPMRIPLGSKGLRVSNGIVL
jgi:PhnB protein